MPYKIEWKDVGVKIDFSGRLEFADLFNANISIYENKNSEYFLFQIWDFSDVQKFDFELCRLKTIITMDKAANAFIPKMFIAVISDTLEMNDFCNQYNKEFKNSEWNCRLFHQLNDAQQWIKENIPNIRWH